MERAYRTIDEALEGEDLENYGKAHRVLSRIITWYNAKRLHSALGFLRPVVYYRGFPNELHKARRKKLADARHRRKEQNLRLRQPTLPLEPVEVVA